MAEKKDLWKLPDVPPTNVYLYLYSINIEGNCIPETHYTCSYHYYLAAREDGLSPAISLFDLGKVGKIEKIQWVAQGDISKAVIIIDTSNYPKSILKMNKSLKQIHGKYKLVIEKDPKSKNKYNNLTKYRLSVEKIK